MANSKEIDKPPYDSFAEQSVLGTLLLKSNLFDEVSNTIIAEDFYLASHRIIFQAIKAVYEKENFADTVTVNAYLRSIGRDKDVGGLAYLAQIAKDTPSTVNILAHANTIKDSSIRRNLIAVSHKIAESAYNPNGEDIDTLLNNAEQQVYEIANVRSSAKQGPEEIKSVLSNTLVKLEELSKTNPVNGLTGLTTGFHDLNEKTSGLQPSDLIIVAARPAMGKTTFAMNICENAALTRVKRKVVKPEEEKDVEKSSQDTKQEGKGKKKKPEVIYELVYPKPVLIFSMEMPAEQLMMRMFSSLSNVEQRKIKTGQDLTDQDWGHISSTVTMLKQANNIFIDDSPNLTPTEIRSRARRVASQHDGLSLIVIDYLQLMRVNGRYENRNLEIAAISRSLKALAKELNVPVIALSQLSRAVENRPNKRPVNSDLRESGAIEQDADIIMFIYRDEVYNGSNEENHNLGEIIISKHRNGEIGTVKLCFEGAFSRFRNLAYNTPYEN